MVMMIALQIPCSNSSSCSTCQNRARELRQTTHGPLTPATCMQALERHTGQLQRECRLERAKWFCRAAWLNVLLTIPMARSLPTGRCAEVKQRGRSKLYLFSGLYQRSGEINVKTIPCADALFKELQLGEARLEATDFMVLAPPSIQQICLPLHCSGLASLTVKLNRLDSALC